MFKHLIRPASIVFMVAGLSCCSPLPSQGGFNVNIDLGSPASPPPPVYYVPPPPPVYAPPPPPAPPEVVVQTEPQFVYDPAIGMYVAAGVPYDLFYNGSEYFYLYGGRWYRGEYFTGPWITLERRYVPPVFFQVRIEEIRLHRDREYDRFRREGARYQGRVYHPEPRAGHDFGERRAEHRAEPREVVNGQGQQRMGNKKEERIEEHKADRDGNPKPGIKTVPNVSEQRGKPQKLAPQRSVPPKDTPKKQVPKNGAPKKETDKKETDKK